MEMNKASGVPFLASEQVGRSILPQVNIWKYLVEKKIFAQDSCFIEENHGRPVQTLNRVVQGMRSARMELDIPSLVRLE